VQTVFGEPESDGAGVDLPVPDHIRNRK